MPSLFPRLHFSQPSEEASASPTLLIWVIKALHTTHARDEVLGLPLLYFKAASDTCDRSKSFLLLNSTPPHFADSSPTSLGLPHPSCTLLLTHPSPLAQWGLSCWDRVCSSLALAPQELGRSLALHALCAVMTYIHPVSLPRPLHQAPDCVFNCQTHSCTWMVSASNTVWPKQSSSPSLHFLPHSTTHAEIPVLTLPFSPSHSQFFTNSPQLYLQNTSFTGPPLCTATAITRT